MKVQLQSTLVLLLLILSCASSFGQQKSYLGTPPPPGAKLYLDGSNASLQHPSFFDMLVSLMTHPLFTPSVVFPIVDTVAFLSSVWWSYWYSFKLATNYLKLRHIVIK